MRLGSCALACMQISWHKIWRWVTRASHVANLGRSPEQLEWHNHDDDVGSTKCKTTYNGLSMIDNLCMSPYRDLRQIHRWSRAHWETHLIARPTMIPDRSHVLQVMRRFFCVSGSLITKDSMCFPEDPASQEYPGNTFKRKSEVGVAGRETD